MKIDHILPPSGIVSQNENKSQRTENNGAFHQLLEDRLRNEATTEAAPVQHSMPLTMPISPDNEAFAIEKIEQTLNNLETYQKMLGDPKVNMRDMDPYVGQLKQDANRLSEISEQMGKDNGIKPVVKDALRVISEEVGRFERGEYMD